MAFGGYMIPLGADPTNMSGDYLLNETAKILEIDEF